MRLVFFLIICIFIIRQSFCRGPIWIVLLLAFIYFLNPEIYIWGIEKYRIVFILNIILLISIKYHYKVFDIVNDRESILILFLLGSFYLSAITACVSQEAALGGSIILLKGIIFWLALKNILKNDFISIDIFLSGILIILTILSLWGIQQYALGNIRLENFGGGQIMGSNQMASAFIWALPIAYYKVLSEIKWKKYLAFGCLLTILSAIVCTQSRQAFVALLFYIMFIFFSSKKKMMMIFWFSFILLLAIPLIPDDYVDRMETIGEYSEDASAVGRIVMWKAAIDVFLDYPLLGVGPKNFYLVAPLYSNEHVRVTHNTYFQLLSEEGIIGFSIFIILVSTSLLSLYKMIIRFKPPSNNVQIYYFSSMSFMSLFGVLICCVFQNKADHEFLYWPIAISAALNSWANKSADN